MPPVLRRLARPAAPLVATLLLLGGCGSSGGTDAGDAGTSSPSTGATPSESASGSAGGSAGGPASASSSPTQESGTAVDIRFADGRVTPGGKQIEIGIGEPLTLTIEADAPGELHVHSTPEQEIAYDAGTLEKTLTFDRPGVVDIESHTLDQLVLRVEVS